MNGFKRGELNVIMAGSKVGKSMLSVEYECKRCKIKPGSNPSPKLLKYCECEVKIKT